MSPSRRFNRAPGCSSVSATTSTVHSSLLRSCTVGAEGGGWRERGRGSGGGGGEEEMKVTSSSGHRNGEVGGVMMNRY